MCGAITVDRRTGTHTVLRSPRTVYTQYRTTVVFRKSYVFSSRAEATKCSELHSSDRITLTVDPDESTHKVDGSAMSIRNSAQLAYHDHLLSGLRHARCRVEGVAPGIIYRY